MRLNLLLATGLLALTGCTQATPVSVVNQSSFPLVDVEISGSGFSQSLGSIAPGARATTRVHPRGESSLALSFRAGSQEASLPPQGYFEGGGRYSVTVVVTPELSGVVNSKLRIF